MATRYRGTTTRYRTNCVVTERTPALTPFHATANTFTVVNDDGSDGEIIPVELHGGVGKTKDEAKTHLLIEAR